MGSRRSARAPSCSIAQREAKVELGDKAPAAAGRAAAGGRHNAFLHICIYMYGNNNNIYI